MVRCVCAEIEFKVNSKAKRGQCGHITQNQLGVQIPQGKMAENGPSLM